MVVCFLKLCLVLLLIINTVFIEKRPKKMLQKVSVFSSSRCKTHQCCSSHGIFWRFIEYIVQSNSEIDRNSISCHETCSKADKKGDFFFEHQRLDLELEQWRGRQKVHIGWHGALCQWVGRNRAAQASFRFFRANRKQMFLSPETLL